MTKVLKAFVLGLAVIGMTTACKRHEPSPGSAASTAPDSNKPAEATLGAALSKTAQFSTVAAAVKETGLEGVFDGKASYTLFAPTNAAFDALGEKGRSLRKPEQRAALAALLREHIVPGMLTAGDIDGALARSGGKPLKLRSMGKGTLSISRQGDAIVIAGADGSRATLTNDSTSAKNGSALGVDGVLRKLG